MQNRSGMAGASPMMFGQGLQRMMMRMQSPGMARPQQTGLLGQPDSPMAPPQMGGGFPVGQVIRPPAMGLPQGMLGNGTPWGGLGGIAPPAGASPAGAPPMASPFGSTGMGGGMGGMAPRSPWMSQGSGY
jgi:hypothetical protein